jgi:selenocysteine-specific elongation factor
MPIIGTAGHVDHGKSTLVQALTGRDPDRWAEEKDRGLTIDLGFAWTRLGDTVVGFVDVPGHERFIKNMLAGVGGFDVALFVVASDEGWMPQSAEHLEVLDVLDVRHGVIALTRTDLADPDLIELSTGEVIEEVAGTVAGDWPIIEVSAPTGHGLDRLIDALVEQLAAAGPPADVGRPRLWVDRVFTISGAGVVVTGTLTGGSLSTGDRLEAFPGRDVRVRGLQSHETAVDTAVPGTRVAVNVVGADREDFERGTLLAAPGSIGMTRRFLTVLHATPGADAGISDRGAYHMHIGTATVPVRIRIIAGDPETVAILTTRTPVPLAMGDRFVVRDTGRRLVAGGGIVIDPFPVKRPSSTDVRTLADAVDGDATTRAGALIAVHGALDAADLERSSGGGSPTGALLIGSRYFSHDAFADGGALLRETVAAYHETFPLRPGIPKSEAASRMRAGAALVAALVDADPSLIDDGPTIRKHDFSPRLDAADETSWNRARELLASDLAVPRVADLGLASEVLHALIRRGSLIRVSDDLVFLPEQIDDVTGRLGTLPGGFTVAEFRDAYGLSRKHAVPLLEWLDAGGWTRRRGDERTVRPSSANGPSADGVPPR